MDTARIRLYNLGLSRADFDNPVQVVDWLVASQAQDYAGAKWALGLRMRKAVDAVIEQAFNEGAILRTHVLRPTWHFVTPADIRWLLALTGPRVQALNAGMARKLELDAATLTRAADVMMKALEGENYRTRDELRDVLEREGIATQGVQRMAYIVMHAELERLICSGPRRGKQFTYALMDERAPRGKTLEGDAALAELARRYIISRGPASAQDFSRWSGLTLTQARAGLEAVKDGLEERVIDGQVYWFRDPGEQAGFESPRAWLLSVYDEYLASYRNFGGVVTAEHGARMVAMGNDLTSVIVVDGQILGTWKRAVRAREVAVTVSPFDGLSAAQAAAVEAAARRYAAYLELPLQKS